MRKLCRLLTSLAFLGWTGGANAALMQEIFFYYPGDGSTVDNFASSSMLPSVTVTLPAPSGLCISPCWEIGVHASDYDPSRHSAAWVTDSFQASGQWNTPAGGGPVEFNPLDISAEILKDGEGEPIPFTAVITHQDELPPGSEQQPGATGGEGGEGSKGDEGGQGGEGSSNPLLAFNAVEYCSPDSQGQDCIVGSAINRSVPLPSTLLLFAVGLAGLARFRPLS